MEEHDPIRVQTLAPVPTGDDEGTYRRIGLAVWRDCHGTDICALGETLTRRMSRSLKSELKSIKLIGTKDADRPGGTISSSTSSTNMLVKMIRMEDGNTSTSRRRIICLVWTCIIQRRRLRKGRWLLSDLEITHHHCCSSKSQHSGVSPIAVTVVPIPHHSSHSRCSKPQTNAPA